MNVQSCWPMITLVIFCTEIRRMKSQPYSVVKFPGVEALYLQVRPQNIGLPPQRLELDWKWGICTKLFRQSTGLVRFAEDLINPQEYLDELAGDARYRHIFDETFEPVASSSSDPSAPGPSQRYVYVNRSRERGILVHGLEYTENVFTCMTYRKWSEPARRVIKQYYVSHNHYDMNEVPSGNKRIHGRIIFAHDEQNNVVVHAVADEYAQQVAYNNRLGLEYYYVTRFGIATPSPADDPVCKLDYGRRLRLCNSLFLAYRSVPFKTGVNRTCERMKFRINGIEQWEWAISCETAGYLRLRRKISRSYVDNQVFVYERGAHGFYLSGCFKNIGVVRDGFVTVVPPNLIQILGSSSVPS